MFLARATSLTRLGARRLCASPCTYEGEPAQRTLVAFKPDTLQRALLGETLARFERRGLKHALRGLERSANRARRGPPAGVAPRPTPRRPLRRDPCHHRLVGLKMVRPTRELVEAHYEEHRAQPFFERACTFLASGPVVASVWEGRGAISAVRSMIGVTEPLESAADSVRGAHGLHWRRNLVHGSDSVESAAREIGLWFGPDEIVSWEQALAPWLYELPTSRTTWDDG